jgi:isopenicillin N synthase-like dioxygenase
MNRDETLVQAQQAWARAGLDRIPVLDLAAYLADARGALDTLAAQLRHAQENIGFFYIAGHGVPQALVDRMFAATAAFHAQPMEHKLSVKIDSDQSGYIPIGGSVVNSDLKRNNKPDQSEAIWIRRERDPAFFECRPKRRFEAPNKWPAGMDEFRATVLEYMAAMDALGRKMLPIYARALDLPLDFFADKFVDNDISVRAGHYPPTPGGDPNQFGAAPHTDAGFLTLLPQAEVRGLEIMTQAGDWLPAPVRPGEILVNGGDCLVRFTNGRFLSTPHRVVTGLPRDRYSIPLFFNPAFDAVVAPVATCVSAAQPSRFEPITYQDYILGYLARYYPHQAAVNNQGAAA